MTNDNRENRVMVELGDKILWLSMSQMQCLFNCILAERDTDSYALLGLYLSDNLKADNERRMVELQRQQEIELKKIEGDIE